MARKQRKRSAKKRTGAAASKAATPTGRWRFDWTALGVWALLLLPPFVLLPGIADSFRLPKLMVSEALAMLAVALLGFRLLRPAEGEPVRSFGWRSPALLATVPLSMVASLGLWTSPHRAMVDRALPSLWVGAAFLVAATAFLRRDERLRMLRVLCGPALVLAVLGLFQALGLWQPMAFEGSVSQRLSVTSLAGGAFDLGAWLLLPSLVAQERVMHVRGRARWLWLFGLALPITGALVATQTLGVFAAWIVASLVLWCHHLLHHGVRWQRLAMVSIATLALGVATILLVAPLRERVGVKVQQLAQGDLNSVLTGRLDGWRAALWMAGEHPLAGVGHGAYRSEFGTARLTLVAEGVPFFPGHNQAYFVNAHNEFLEVLAECGWPGALLVLGVVGLLGRRVWTWSRSRARVPDADDADTEVGTRGLVLAGCIAMVLVALTNFPFRLALVAYPWLFFLSIVLADPVSAVAGEPVDGGLAAPKRRSRRLAVVALLVLGVAGCLWSVERGRSQVGAQRLVAITEALARQSMQVGRMPPRALDLGLDYLRSAEDKDPANVSVPVTRGGLYFVAERYEAAARAYHEATAIESRPEIWVNLARTHLELGDHAAALAAAENALALDPRKLDQLRALPGLAADLPAPPRRPGRGGQR